MASTAQRQTVVVPKSSFIAYAVYVDEMAMELMLREKSVEYSSATGDHLALENRMAKLIGVSPEAATMFLLSKHIAALFILMEKSGPDLVSLDKLDERVIDACNMLKILGSFVHERRETNDNDKKRQACNAPEDVRPGDR